ncbi:uncharacterized protein BCR38DRAFT_518039 [Pseudomassariella vexata]|uniref:Extracellular membrane protein CFEM domain-containing protein n=1 Tax=Pseudomassariella vexata TaxID=1141098 RepID=A0A1Y2DTF6_9PEZI|nr:uncharacterized protein BCR38DRAFT_518039 [Pseudomassariella vexata]ORY62449.1 hypothetical protein BCR38DRAFT_518039 [Pseudomassariella vexata]
MSNGSKNDLFLSKGTCFFAKGQVADPRFIPCGNADISGPQPCCYEGDFCLSSAVCWDNERCTDATFTSSKCVTRFEYPDQQWVAMARCDGADVSIWSGCAKHPDLIEIKKENCQCTASKALINNPNGKSSFDLVGSLPPTAGGTISFDPTAIPTSISAWSSGSTPAPTGTVISPMTPPSSASSSHQLSTGAKAGAGLGATSGALLTGVLAYLAIKLRRKKTTAPELDPHQQAQPSTPAQLSASNEPPNPREDRKTTDYDTVFYRDKPELHADTAHKSELPGDELHSGKEISELSNKEADGNTKAISSLSGMSPQSTGGLDNRVDSVGLGGAYVNKN